MRRFLFLGGIPGSGKTTLGRSLQARGAAISVTAGDLLRRAKAQDNGERVRVRDAGEAHDNQSILVSEVQKVIRSTSLSVILDGHFVIPSEAGLIPVEASVFTALGVETLALLLVEPNDAAKRLRERKQSAAWWDGSVSALERFQELELETARRTAVACSLRLVELRDPAEVQLFEILGGSAGSE